MDGVRHKKEREMLKMRKLAHWPSLPDSCGEAVRVKGRKRRGRSRRAKACRGSTALTISRECLQI